MKWKVKQPPVWGDTRIIKRFLLSPKTLRGECRWLEIAYIRQSYNRHVETSGLANYYVYRWTDIRWAKESEG